MQEACNDRCIYSYAREQTLVIEENIRSSLLPDHGRVALLLLDVDRIPFSHSGRVERNGGTSVGNRYLLSGMGEIAGAVERKIKKMGGRAWHVSTRKLGSTARRGASTIRKKVGWERELPWEERRKRRGRERVKKEEESIRCGIWK